MAKMPDIEAEAARAVAAAKADLGHLFHRHPVSQDGDAREVVVIQDSLAAQRQWNAWRDVEVTTQTPATTPVNLAAATAAAPQQEDNMSLFDDAEKIYAGAKTELAKFEEALPGVLAKAKAFEASPFAQLAEKTAASVLPPEAVTIAVNAADRVLDDLIGLYSTPAPTDTQQQPVQQGAPAQ